VIAVSDPGTEVLLQRSAGQIEMVNHAGAIASVDMSELRQVLAPPDWPTGVVINCFDRTELWSPRTRNVRRLWDGFRYPCLSRDGRWLAGMGYGIEVHELREPFTVRESPPKDYLIFEDDVAEDAHHLAGGGDNGLGITRVDTAEGVALSTATDQGVVWSAASEDDQYLLGRVIKTQFSGNDTAVTALHDSGLISVWPVDTPNKPGFFLILDHASSFTYVAAATNQFCVTSAAGDLGWVELIQA
jgi:hypothetical protein